MKRHAWLALSLGLALFVGLLLYQGLGPVLDLMARAGWGVLALTAFHLLPLVLDAAAIKVVLPGPPGFAATVGARWAGESVNSLLPAGQMGGPVVMARLLLRGGARMADAGAAVTASATQQMVAQAVFALLGLILLLGGSTPAALAWTLVPGLALCALALAGFLRLQHHGMFAWLARCAARLAPRHEWTALAGAAARLDAAVQAMYQRPGPVLLSFALSLLGWLVGTGETAAALWLVGHPVSLRDALLLESLGQAVRGIAFAIPGALGVQEGGYLLLGPLVGLPPDAALALPLCKRARELLLGLPGLLYWHGVERGWAARSRDRREVRSPAPQTPPSP